MVESVYVTVNADLRLDNSKVSEYFMDTVIHEINLYHCKNLNRRQFYTPYENHKEQCSSSGQRALMDEF